jgi:hypothetical protein
MSIKTGLRAVIVGAVAVWGPGSSEAAPVVLNFESDPFQVLCADTSTCSRTVSLYADSGVSDFTLHYTDSAGDGAAIIGTKIQTIGGLLTSPSFVATNTQNSTVWIDNSFGYKFDFTSISLYKPADFEYSLLVTGISQQGQKTAIIDLSEADKFVTFGLTGFNNISALYFETLNTSSGNASHNMYFDGLTFNVHGPAFAVPGPIAGASLPTLMALGGFMWARRRKSASSVRL